MKTYQEYLNEDKKLSFRHPFNAYDYAKKRETRIPEVEENILNSGDATIAGLYASNVIHGRWPEAEAMILENPVVSSNYARECIRGRWAEGEDSIKKNEVGWKNYLMFLFNYGYNDKDKWQWLREDINSNLIEVLNTLGMKSDMQEYIIKERPDLAGEIKRLNPDIIKKYKHELGLFEIEV